MSKDFDPTFELVIDQVADSFSPQIMELAQHCARAFSRKQEKVQVSHLEQLGRSTRRFNDLIAYVMRQTGKSRAGQSWQTRCGEELFGTLVIRFLEKIKQRASEQFGEEGPLERQEHDENALRLKVAAICLRNLHSAYLYLSLDEVQ